MQIYTEFLIQTRPNLPSSSFLMLTDRLEAVGGKQTAPSMHCYSNPSSGGRTISQSITVLWIGYQICFSRASLLDADNKTPDHPDDTFIQGKTLCVSQHLLNRQEEYSTCVPGEGLHRADEQLSFCVITHSCHTSQCSLHCCSLASTVDVQPTYKMNIRTRINVYSPRVCVALRALSHPLVHSQTLRAKLILLVHLLYDSG